MMIQGDCLQALVALALFGDCALACAIDDEPEYDGEKVVWHPGGWLDVRLSRKANAIVRALDKVTSEIRHEAEEAADARRGPAHYDLTTLSDLKLEAVTAEENFPGMALPRKMVENIIEEGLPPEMLLPRAPKFWSPIIPLEDLLSMSEEDGAQDDRDDEAREAGAAEGSA